MLPDYVKKELEAEFGGLNFKQPSEELVNSVTVKGYRLKREEKESLAFSSLNFGLDLNNYQEVRNELRIMRRITKKMEQEEKEWNKHFKEFIKEWRRLSIKYDSFDEDEKKLTINQLMKRWDNNYYELNFIWEYQESIKYHGGKNYAQYYCATRGICPDSEVEMWK